MFGIYPGGSAGTVGPSGAVQPEDPAKRLAALQQLAAPGHPFLVHLYASYTGPGGWSAAQQVSQQVSQYASAGFDVELVLAYRPADGGSSTAVAGFTTFVSDTVRAFAATPRFVSLQVTNEANVGGAPNASDGYYADAKDALLQGVIAAKTQIRANGATQIKVGFNWANANDPGESAFWRYLGTHGGRAFESAVDWVGLDAYPGTWGPALPSGDLRSATAAVLTSTFNTLRQTYLPLAGIPASVPLHISECGYPTGPGRTDAMQATSLQASVQTVDADRSTYNITNYNWFDLRDADSSSTRFESQYGLMTDDYTPKPAFSTYRTLITTLSNPH